MITEEGNQVPIIVSFTVFVAERNIVNYTPAIIYLTYTSFTTHPFKNFEDFAESFLFQF